MEENRIIIDSAPKEATLLAMGGTDSRGNLWQVDNRSFLKNGKRFLPVMGEFHFSRYEPEDWEEELLKMRAGGVEHRQPPTCSGSTMRKDRGSGISPAAGDLRRLSGDLQKDRICRYGCASAPGRMGSAETAAFRTGWHQDPERAGANQRSGLSGAGGGLLSVRWESRRQA